MYKARKHTSNKVGFRALEIRDNISINSWAHSVSKQCTDTPSPRNWSLSHNLKKQKP